MWENPGDLYWVLRVLRGWTLAQSERATGLAASYISRVERGKHTPSATTVERIQKAYAPNAGPGLRYAMMAAWSADPSRGRDANAKQTAERVMQLLIADIGLQILAGTLGAPWPDPNKLAGRGYEWALWAVLMWAEEWSNVNAACASNDRAAVEGALGKLRLTGGLSPDERDGVSEQELAVIWRRLDAVGRSRLLNVARRLVDWSGSAGEVDVARAAQQAFPNLDWDVQNAIATLVYHTSQ